MIFLSLKLLKHFYSWIKSKSHRLHLHFVGNRCWSYVHFPLFPFSTSIRCSCDCDGLFDSCVFLALFSSHRLNLSSKFFSSFSKFCSLFSIFLCFTRILSHLFCKVLQKLSDNSFGPKCLLNYFDFHLHFLANDSSQWDYDCDHELNSSCDSVFLIDEGIQFVS